jgi:hypothetical protein
VVSADGHEHRNAVHLKDRLYQGEEIIRGVLLPLLGADLDFPSDVELTSSSCMNLYRMDVIRDNDLRFISERYAIAEDLYFNVDYFMHSRRIVSINEQGYYYFENQGSISRKYDPKRFERTLNYYEEVQKQVKQYDLADIIAYRVDRSFIMKVRVAIRHVVLSELTRKEKLSQIRRMLEADTVKKVLDSYPIDSLIPAMRLLTKWMRKEKVARVYWLMKLREYAKGVSWLKKSLKRIGIGKASV